MIDRFHATFFACLVSILAGAPRLGGQPTTPQVTMYSAQFAVGPQGAGLWSTNAFVENTSPGDNSCTINLIDPNGKPAVVATTTMGSGSTFNATIPENGSWSLYMNSAGSS